MSWKDFHDVPDQFKLYREVVQTDLPKRLEYADVPNELKGRRVVILTALQHNKEVPFHKLPQRLLSDEILLIEVLCLVQAADCEPKARLFDKGIPQSISEAFAERQYFRSICRVTKSSRLRWSKLGLWIPSMSWRSLTTSHESGSKSGTFEL
jgi:hypothetical protein